MPVPGGADAISIAGPGPIETLPATYTVGGLARPEHPVPPWQKTAGAGMMMVCFPLRDPPFSQPFVCIGQSDDWTVTDQPVPEPELSEMANPSVPVAGTAKVADFSPWLRVIDPDTVTPPLAWTTSAV